MALPFTRIEIVKGEDNLVDIDLAVDLDPTDEVWFTAKYERSDTDANAAIAKKRSTGGIVDVDTPQGKCQVKILKANADALTGRALVFDVKLKKADQSTVQTVGTGVAILVDGVNKNAA
jgi:hypothetical protein